MKPVSLASIFFLLFLWCTPTQSQGLVKLVNLPEKATFSADDYYRKGLFYFRKGVWEKAIEFFSLALEIDSQHIKARFNRGLSWYELHRFNKAKTDFDKVLETDQNNVEAFALRGLVYFKEERYEEAIADFTRGLSIQKKEQLFIYRATVYHRLGYFRDAFLDFDQALRLNDKSALACSGKGDVYASLKQYQIAILWYDKALKINMNDALVHNNKGRALSKLRKFDEALKSFDEALWIAPQSQIFLNRGLCYLELENPRSAKSDGVTALRMDPDNPDAYYCIGLAELKEQMYLAAVESFDIAIDVDSKTADYFMARGRALLLLGQYDQAKENFKRALEIQPNSVKANELMQSASKASKSNIFEWLKEKPLSAPNLDYKNLPALNSESSYLPGGAFFKKEEPESNFYEDPY